MPLRSGTPAHEMAPPEPASVAHTEACFKAHVSLPYDASRPEQSEVKRQLNYDLRLRVENSN